MYYDIHPLANLVAMANEKEQIALTEDIKNNGQNQPAVLWRGKIVDGRCRQLACQTLGVALETRELDAKLTRNEVTTVVKSLNTRRNLTMTQKIVSAYKEQDRSKATNTTIAKEWAISERSLKNCKYIAKYRPEFIEPLFNGDSVKINDPDKGFKITSNKIGTLVRIIKRELEAGKVEVVSASAVDAMEFNVDSAINTEAGRKFHNEMYTMYSHSASKNEIVSALLTELANLKYRIEDK